MPMMGRPREFGEHFNSTGDPGEGVPLVAPTHWRAAEHLRFGGNTQLGPFLQFGVSAICLYHAALDCFLNEALAEKIVKGNPQEVEHCIDLQDLPVSENKIASFLSEFRITDTFDVSILADVAKFMRLRGKLYHHAPQLISFDQSPVEALDVFRAAAYEPVDMAWVMLVAAPEVVQWCANVVSDFYLEYHRARHLLDGAGMFGFLPREGVSARMTEKSAGAFGGGEMLSFPPGVSS
jgi:hypothetical protein